jgi:DNA segregation ATPase FtsK/SpoIIIE, S-DNA-T family
MSVIERAIPLVSHLPDPVREILARRFRELAGLGLVILAGAAGASLASWSVLDPSLSHATSAPIHNLLGYGGAIGSDLLMQLIGLGSIMLLLPIATWGWRLMTHRAFDREILRLTSWVLCVAFATAFFSCLPRSAGWPLPTGIGGVVGDAILRLPQLLLG